MTNNHIKAADIGQTGPRGTSPCI